MRRLPPGRVVTLTKLGRKHHESAGGKRYIIGKWHENEPAIVGHPLLRAPLGRLLLLLLVDFWRTGLDFTRTSERSVDWRIFRLLRRQNTLDPPPKALRESHIKAKPTFAHLEVEESRKEQEVMRTIRNLPIPSDR